jgi:hypothetical protein
VKLAASLNDSAVPKSRDKAGAEPLRSWRRLLSPGKKQSSTWRIRRGKECDTTPKTRGVNWGTSENLNALGIRHKPRRKLRGSDVAIVSDEPAGQHNRLGSQGPLDWRCDQRGAVPLGESRLRNKRCTRRASTGAGYKRWARR